MKSLIILSSLFALSCSKMNKELTPEPTSNQTEIMNKENIYQFKVKDIEGNDFDLASLKGKKVMIVNTASECGLTPQFEQLQSLYSEFKNNNFVIIGFPTNDFMGQDPGSNQEIAAFCQKNYGVTFPMMEKIVVKGDDKNEVYKFLTEKSKNGLGDFDVEWNFQKFLINENGELERVFGPRILPNDTEIKNWIKGTNS
ncbi:glutathione peroxidase [Paenimyroides tangerinum]|uniref:Glutathione peroxidase n=1 Tax=Paenimyroides tangerinum TaxID=2488728 RepID=A0A3P3W2Z2_9FLAO|nr:glutathione peroxidase [Paenimyroides tangerinum]